MRPAATQGDPRQPLLGVTGDTEVPGWAQLRGDRRTTVQVHENSGLACRARPDATDSCESGDDRRESLLGVTRGAGLPLPAANSVSAVDTSSRSPSVGSCPEYIAACKVIYRLALPPGALGILFATAMGLGAPCAYGAYKLLGEDTPTSVGDATRNSLVFGAVTGVVGGVLGTLILHLPGCASSSRESCFKGAQLVSSMLTPVGVAAVLSIPSPWFYPITLNLGGAALLAIYKIAVRTRRSSGHSAGYAPLNPLDV